MRLGGSESGTCIIDSMPLTYSVLIKGLGCLSIVTFSVALFWLLFASDSDL